MESEPGRWRTSRGKGKGTGYSWWAVQGTTEMRRLTAPTSCRTCWETVNLFEKKQTRRKENKIVSQNKREARQRLMEAWFPSAVTLTCKHRLWSLLGQTKSISADEAIVTCFPSKILSCNQWMEALEDFFVLFCLSSLIGWQKEGKTWKKWNGTSSSRRCSVPTRLRLQ